MNIQNTPKFKIGDTVRFSMLGNLTKGVIAEITRAGNSASNPNEPCYRVQAKTFHLYIVESALRNIR